jgi:hypothetical protein
MAADRSGYADIKPSIVMAGLVPAIHVLLHYKEKDVDARHEAGHDEGKAKL